MSDSGRQAIFISYAREDTEAARRIADALEGQGLEVWFDQSELLGGDAWDAKIRRQIRDCTLFLPVISANTQTRREGYFRLEWRLADQRTHLMGRDKAFLVPVCIDDTPEGDADVPDSFLAVQWTRLPDGYAKDSFQKRVLALLAGETITGALAPRSAHPAPVAAPRPSTNQRRSTRKWLVPLLMAAAAVAVIMAWHFRPGSHRGPAENLPPEAALDIEKVRKVLGHTNYGQDELALAEGYMAKATDAAPDSAEAWALRGFVQATYILRTWDEGKDRQRDAQAFCQKALALDADNVDAMLGLAYVCTFTGADAQSEGLMRKATQLAKNDPRLWRELGIAVYYADGHQAGLRILRENTQRFPRDPLTWYDLGLYQWFDGNTVEALADYRQVVKLAPVGNAYMAIAELLAEQGDLAGADAVCAQIPLENRSSDRAVGLDMWLGILQRNPSRVIAAEGRTAADYFTDAEFRGPKAFLSALAYQIAGKQNLAAQSWDEAIRVVRERLKTAPNDFDQMNLAVALAWRGERTEAAAIVAPIEPAQREMDIPSLGKRLAEYYAALGEASQAIFYLDKVGSGALITTKLDPWWDRIRETPAFNDYFASHSAQSVPKEKTPP